jgi:hypothetical protein
VHGHQKRPRGAVAALVWVACAGWSADPPRFVAITFSDTAAKRGMTASGNSIAAQIDAETRHLNWLNVRSSSRRP